MSKLLYLSSEDIAALDIKPQAAREALAHAFRLHAEGKTHVQPKLTVAIGPGHFFQSLCAAMPDPPYATTKWVGVAADNSERGLPNVNGLIVVNDYKTGVPVAVLDGTSITVLRTAAMSALAASYLARPDSFTIGFIGCGAQAYGHLDNLRDALPGLRKVVCSSRGRSSAEKFAAYARESGLDAEVSNAPDEALACDVVVSTVPAQPGLEPFLDAALLKPGCFVAAVDLGRPWHGEGLRALDILATDDHAQAADPANRAKLRYPGPFDADLASLVAGTSAGRTDEAQRTMFLFPGFALGDLAIAAEVIAEAKRAGRGLHLPL
ncbi:ornithine cyclodeaminase family protein [Microvirga sp. ACRRW]|uniref:ornithine cyclodeaminase family protein n=1 Tax=Microvirga sp. ACRRW TaxID=2918205 RepID=UPI001EF6C386|nr:ornithine cyclodeaminase family protein [Microvirga sp. ACRRW]MCG7391594.1 ornithine cyclodeaminase family protein [Microvirga sp. ACRRW]